jgi:hypothetical protein
MRFKTFLMEDASSGYRNIKEPTAIKYAQSMFKESLQPDVPYIIRGMDSGYGNYTNYFFVNNIRGRVSANTSNEYTTIIDNSPAWAEYPKRSRSLICTTSSNLEYARDFGDPFIILPTPDTKIAVCSKYDFWDSFPVVSSLLEKAKYSEFNNQMSLFNDAVRSIFDAAKFKLSESNTSFERLKRALNVGTVYLRDPDSPHVSSEDKVFFKSVINGTETMLEFVERILNPNSNRFKLVKYNELPTLKNKNLELWLEGPVLAFGCYDITTWSEIKREYDRFKEKVFKS